MVTNTVGIQNSAHEAKFEANAECTQESQGFVFFSQCVCTTFYWQLKKKELNTRQNAHHPSTRTQYGAEGRSSGKGAINWGWQHQCSTHAHNSEQFLIFRDMGLVYVREHRSNVRTIEQILFKYSRTGGWCIHSLYSLKWRYCKTYGIKMRLSLHSCQFFLGVIEGLITFCKFIAS